MTLPMLLPTISVAGLLRFIDCIKTFDIIYGMTGGGPGFSSETLNIYTYNQAFYYFNFGYASALARHLLYHRDRREPAGRLYPAPTGGVAMAAQSTTSPRRNPATTTAAARQPLYALALLLVLFFC